MTPPAKSKPNSKFTPNSKANSSSSFKSTATISKSNSKSRSLALVVVEDCSIDQLVPLITFDPKILSQTCLRRSPRFSPVSEQVTPQNVGQKRAKRASSAPISRYSIDSVDEKRLKRSPRLWPAEPVENGNVVGHSTSKKPKVKMLHAGCFRRSPRFTPISVQVTPPNAVKKGAKKFSSASFSGSSIEALGAQRLRKSPRLLPASVTEIENADGNSSSAKSKAKMSNARALRSSPRFAGTGNGNAESTSHALSDSFGRKTSKKGSDSVKDELGLVNGKSTRCTPRFYTSVVGSVIDDKTRTVDQGQKSKCQSFPSNVDKEEIVSGLESLEGALLTTSPRLTSNQPRSDINCSKSSSQKIFMSSSRKGCFDALSMELANIEMELSGVLEKETLHFSSDEHSKEELIPLNCESNVPLNCGSEYVVEIELAKSPQLVRANIEANLLNEGEARKLTSTNEDDDEEPTPNNFNSRFSLQSDLRRSPGHAAAEDNVKIHSLREPGTEILSEKQLRSPRQLSTLAESGKINLSSTLIDLPNLSDNWSAKESQISEIFDFETLEEKCLRRSPRLNTALFGSENGKTRFSFTGFPESIIKQPPQKKRYASGDKQKKFNSATFIGDPIPFDEAQERWRWRYELKSQSLRGRNKTHNEDEEDEVVLDVDCHYAQAKVDNNIFSLGDCAYIKGEGGRKYVGRIIEFFKTTNGENYFRVQWFYRAEDTVIQDQGAFHDKRRLFYSTIMNDNLIDCIISKVIVTQMTPMVGLKQRSLPPFNFYYDMEYCVDYSTFRTVSANNSVKSIEFPTPNGNGNVPVIGSTNILDNIPSYEYKAELKLLDLYSGCGGMSTGLCLGARVSCVNLVTRWAVDSRKSACESLKLNHPEVNVRNESAENFLELLKEWEKLCHRYKVDDMERMNNLVSETLILSNDVHSGNDDEVQTDEYEVSSLVDICFGDPDKKGQSGLKFKVHWKGYAASEDTWEPIEGLSNCEESIKDFVRKGFRLKILPLPGDVDVICGGPPCQGISGYNRFRNVDSPLCDERNRQIVVFMDIVEFLQPKYVLMENVADILRFDKASLGRYALSRLVHMKYQARLGTIAAGCYGLPQFRLRVFLWGAHHREKLPQFPLPTHEVIVRYWPSPEFERNTVAYEEDQPRELEKAVVLQDAISDLPAVSSQETREEMPYEKPPETEFQRYIRSTQYDMTGSPQYGITRTECQLYDHRPYLLNEDDYLRVCKIPKRKGANFRDLPGVIVGKDNVARRDKEDQMLLPSGKPLVPDYAFTFEQGKSKRPFARLWWDETVPTVVTFPSCHNQAALHPEQDRALTVREYARLQGFPDYYRFCGSVKERYCQVGNAVAVPVGRALGYSLGLAIRKLGGDEPTMILPHKFSHSNYFQLAKTLSEDSE